MLAYGTMQKSAAWKLYAKSQGIPFETANAVSEQIQRYEKAYKHADEDSRDEIDIADYISPAYTKIYEGAAAYIGLVTSWSISPCSYLLYSGNIRKEIGLVKIKDHICCLMDGHWAEEGHFLKNDLLKVVTVDLMYRGYECAGIPIPTVNELIKMCPPDDPCWDIYAKGITMGINQVEQEGTSARVKVYKPTNISELSAFVAAIRPGFSSMYGIFASRQPFKYGVKAFDDIIQTEEMPNSFVLYQEMEMAALNFAGIPMSEAYTAIKNIAKKRAEKVYAIKETFVDGFTQAIINEGKTPERAGQIAEQLWQIIQDSARYSFNSSHSYCVALDSLYGAWLKAHHPLAFYEAYLNVQYEKGDKDKMLAAKQEAEEFYHIMFPPFRFGQDNRSIKADIKTNTITNTLASIKSYSAAIGDLLYECGQQGFTSFFDVLLWLDERSIKSARIKPLIQIGYFADFGNTRELTAILLFWDLLHKNGDFVKGLKKETLDEATAEFVSRFATDKGVKGNVLKSYMITDMPGLLAALEAAVKSQHLPELDYKTQMENQLEILGYIDLTTGNEGDRRKLIVTDKVVALTDKTSGKPWCYRLSTRSIGSGKTARISIKAPTYTENPLNKGDILYAETLQKNNAGYWYLLKYHRLA